MLVITKIFIRTLAFHPDTDLIASDVESLKK